MYFKKQIRPLWQVVRHTLIQEAEFDIVDILSSIEKEGIVIERTPDFGDILDKNPRNPDFFFSINVKGDVITFYR